MLKFSFRQQVLAGFVVSIILVLVVGVLSYNSIRKFEDDNRWVDHTQKVIKSANNLLQHMIDAETGMRGYAATGNKVFLEPYNEALPRINVDLQSMRDLTVDNLVQQKRIDSLTTYVTAQRNILKTNIDTREAKGLEFMVANNMLLNGKENMDMIRKLVTHAIDSESSFLNLRKQSSEKASNTAVIIIIGGSFVFLFNSFVLFFQQACFFFQLGINGA